MHTISTSIDLDATPAATWRALTDLAAYPTWNPFIRRIEGPLTPGSELTVRIEPPGGKPMTFRPTVTEVDPRRRLAWLGRFLLPGLADGAHSFTLEPLADGRTRLVQSESFTGVLVWFSRGLLRRTEAGFNDMNAALRQRLSALAHEEA